MKLIIYIFSLFLIFTPNFIFRFSKKLTIPILLLYSIIFTVVFYFTYDLVNNKEGFQISDFNIDNVNPFVKVLSSIIGSNDSAKVNINNDFGTGTIMSNVESPEAANDNVVKPIRYITSNTPEQEKSLQEHTEIVTKQYQQSYSNYLSGADDNNYNYVNDLQNGCKANYNDPNPCCGQPETTITASHICPKTKPLCMNYIDNEQMGTCGTNGGIIGNKVVVLGDYNIKPWNMSDKWIDQGAKWIWFTDNADNATSPNSNAVFEYVYFLDKSSNPSDYIDCEFHIACDCYCYIELYTQYRSTIDKDIQEGTANGTGRLISCRLYNGANMLKLYCYNVGYENNSAGLLCSMVTNQGDKKNILFNSDSSWTWYQTMPLMESVILKNNITYLPIIALWNKGLKGFLMMNSQDNYSILKSENKKLYNTLECENTFFQCQYNSSTANVDVDSVSLFNCNKQHYIFLENNKYLVVENNTNNSVSFVLGGSNAKKYLSMSNPNQLEISNANDSASQWEVIYIDIVHVGSNKKVSVPKYIGHVGTTPLNNNNTTSNDTFIVKNEEDQLINDYNNTIEIVRVDASKNSTWSQDLLLPGINEQYLTKVTPEFKILFNNNQLFSRQLEFYKGMIICLDNKGIVYTKNMSNENENWNVISNPTINVHGISSGLGGNMVIGKFNNKDVLFAVGPLITVSWSKTNKYGAIYYRFLDSLHDSNSTWQLYSKQTDGSAIVYFNNITYCDKNQKVYGISQGYLYDIHYNNGYVLKTQLKTMVAIDYIVYPLKSKNGYIIGINQNLHIFRQPINFNNNQLGEILVIANNVEVTKIAIVHDIIFALGKYDGKVYYTPLYGGLLQLLDTKLEGNIINITIANDVLYGINNNNNILKTQIVL